MPTDVYVVVMMGTGGVYTGGVYRGVYYRRTTAVLPPFTAVYCRAQSGLVLALSGLVLALSGL